MSLNFGEEFRKKIVDAETLRDLVGPPPRSKKVVMCHGTFDIVHPGHIRHLIYAKEKGDILVVSLTADAHIVKANFRPYVPQDLRAINLAALEFVDYVLIDQDAVPLNNIGTIQPDYFVKGYEYGKDALPPKTQAEKNMVESYGGEILFTPGDIVYSSSHIIDTGAPNIGVEKLIMLMQAEDLTFDDLRAALSKIKGTKVHVVGDTIVDTLTHTTLIGGNTKTPTFSVRYESETDHVGGAGIVAKHVKAAMADVTFTTVLGDDALKQYVLDDLNAAGVEVHAKIDPTRPTTRKNAFIADNYRLLKVDTLDNRSISDRYVEEIAQDVKNVGADVVIYSDFRHGIFNPGTIPKLIQAIPDSAFKVADSQVASRWGNILEFTGFDLITPNEREARFALGDQDSVIRPLGSKLYHATQCKTLILKMGARGAIVFRDDGSTGDVRSFFVIDSFADHVQDAVGSGDALLAYAALVKAKTGNEVMAAILGSFAAAVECERDGNIPVTIDDVTKKIDHMEKLANYG